MSRLNTLRPRRNEQHFADDIFKHNFVNENVWISIKISLKFVPNGPINSIPALVQIMAWHRSGDKPLSEPMMENLVTHICVARPQWVKWAKFILPLNNICPLMAWQLVMPEHQLEQYQQKFIFTFISTEVGIHVYIAGSRHSLLYSQKLAFTSILTEVGLHIFNCSTEWVNYYISYSMT